MPWDKCAGICTDGAAARTGINTGVVKRVKDKLPNAQWTHCFLLRQALASKSLSKELHDALNCVIKCVNYINSLNSLNQSMQSTAFTVIDHAAKMTACYKRLILWQIYVD